MSVTKIVVAAVAVAVGCLGQAQATPPSFEHTFNLWMPLRLQVALDINPLSAQMVSKGSTHQPANALRSVKTMLCNKVKKFHGR